MRRGESEGKGLGGGGGGGGGGPASRLRFLFFGRGLSSFRFMTSKSPPRPCPSHLPTAAELIKHQKTAHQFCLVRSLTYERSNRGGVCVFLIMA